MIAYGKGDRVDLDFSEVVGSLKTHVYLVLDIRSSCMLDRRVSSTAVKRE